MFHIFYIICILIKVCNSEKPLQGWNYINLHCRNNENEPVDWWYIYKPPAGMAPKLDLGYNFSYITPETTKWVPSDTLINSNSMLQNTLSPLYRPTYVNLAVIAYSDRKYSNSELGSTARGLMMADEVGGVWLGHTVPSLLDLTVDRPTFPTAELPKGHFIMCLSLNLATLNTLASTIKTVDPRTLILRIPPSMKYALPTWEFFNQRDRRANSTSLPVKPIAFETSDKTLRAVMLFRRPGESKCLYKAFARANRIILDVYGHDQRAYRGCDKGFGIRRIDSISMKYPESVYYIDNSSDTLNFGVSTAAHWQKSSNGPRQYWVCTGTGEMKDVNKGGIVVCVESYNVWWSFDNLKVKEPSCYG